MYDEVMNKLKKLSELESYLKEREADIENLNDSIGMMEQENEDLYGEVCDLQDDVYFLEKDLEYANERISSLARAYNDLNHEHAVKVFDLKKELREAMDAYDERNASQESLDQLIEEFLELEKSEKMYIEYYNLACEEIKRLVEFKDSHEKSHDFYLKAFEKRVEELSKEKESLVVENDKLFIERRNTLNDLEECKLLLSHANEECEFWREKEEDAIQALAEERLNRVELDITPEDLEKLRCEWVSQREALEELVDSVRELEHKNEDLKHELEKETRCRRSWHEEAVKNCRQVSVCKFRCEEEKEHLRKSRLFWCVAIAAKAFAAGSVIKYLMMG